MTPDAQVRYQHARRQLVLRRLAWIQEQNTNHFGLAKFAERAIAGVDARIAALPSPNPPTPGIR